MAVIRDQTLYWTDITDNSSYHNCTIYVPPNVFEVSLITQLLSERGFKDLFMDRTNFIMDERLPPYEFGKEEKPSFKRWLKGN